MAKKKKELKPDFLISEFQEALDEKGSPFQDITGRFSSPEYLNEGGSKRLFILTDKYTQRVIVKAIPKNDSPEYTEAFVKEAQILASLQHPNILPVYDAGTDSEGKPYMFMKLLEGEDLTQYLKNKTLEQKLDIFLTVCDAIAYAHNYDVAHMDLKPENIKISDFGDITICDWGSAVRFDDCDELEVNATPGYAAPEVFEGKKGPLCEIYSLGCLLYEIITGKKLYPQRKIKELIQANKSAQADLSKINDPTLNAICKTALAPNPADRFDSPTAIALRIDLYRKRLPVPEEHAGILRRATLLIKRKPALAGSFALFTIAIALVALYSAYIFNNQKKFADQKKEEAESNLNKYLTEKKERETLQKKHGDMLYEKALQAYGHFQHDDSWDLLQMSIKGAGETPRKLELHGKLQMINYNVNEAVETFKKSGKLKHYQKLIQAIPPWQEMNKKSTKEIIAFISKIRNLDASIYQHMITRLYHNPNRSDEWRQELMKPIFNTFNPSHNFKISENGKKISLFGKCSNFSVFLLPSLRIKSIDFSQCTQLPFADKLKDLNLCQDLTEMNLQGTSFTSLFILKFLKLKKLKLSAGKRYQVLHFHLFPLEELHIAGVTISSLIPLTRMTTLKKVTLSKDMEKLSGFNELKSKVQIIYE